MLNSDYEILLKSYEKLAKLMIEDKKSSFSNHNAEVVSAIEKKAPTLYAEMVNKSGKPEEIRKKVQKAKTLFQQFMAVKGREESVITLTAELEIKRLIQAICLKEAEDIAALRGTELGARFDLERAFSNEKRLRQLKIRDARAIVKEMLSTMSAYFDNIPNYYTTPNGQRYHLATCRYCREHVMTRVSTAMIFNMNLLPCRCVSPKKIGDDNVTVFIDESIYPVAWDYNGNNGYRGKYSYYICRGHLSEENQIAYNNIVYKGVDSADINLGVIGITLMAIKRVLLMLAYEYGYLGNVQIYSDNQIAVKAWGKMPESLKYKALFESVKVEYITRSHNSKADALGRKHILLDLPPDVYNKIVKKCKRDS